MARTELQDAAKGISTDSRGSGALWWTSSQRERCWRVFFSSSGLAEHLFTEEYGQLVAKKRELERLRARRDQYESTLDELSREVLGGHDISVAATASSVADAIDRLEQSSRELQQSRQDAISHAAVGVLSPEEEQVADTLGRERAELLGR